MDFLVLYAIFKLVYLKFSNTFNFSPYKGDGDPFCLGLLFLFS